MLWTAFLLINVILADTNTVWNVLIGTNWLYKYLIKALKFLEIWKPRSLVLVSGSSSFTDHDGKYLFFYTVPVSIFCYVNVPCTQIFYHLGMAWDLRWTTSPHERIKYYPKKQKVFSEPVIPTSDQVLCYTPLSG